MLSKAARISAVLLGFLVSQVSAGVPEDEVMVLTRPEVIAMPEGRVSATPDEIQAPRELSEVLHAIQAQAVRKAMPDFNPADTARPGPYGNTARLPDFRNLYAVRLPTGADRDSAIRRLRELFQVIYAEKNAVPILRQTPPCNDDSFPKQWNLDNTEQSGGKLDADIDAPEAWELSKGSSSVKLGIVDDGVDKAHDDLSAKVLGDDGYDGMHGTFVAGIAAAVTDNDKGIAGVDWHAQIWAERTGDAGVTAQAIIDAVNNGSKVINCSWGWPEVDFPWTIYYAFVYAYTQGVLPVVAVAKEGEPEYPDRFGLWNLLVNASNDEDQYPGPPFTGKRYTDIAAPGITIYQGGGNINILSTIPEDKYGHAWGTSFAAPQATGVAGLLLAANPNLRNYDLEWMIKLSSEDKYPPGWGQERDTSPILCSTITASYKPENGTRLRDLVLALPRPRLAPVEHAVVPTACTSALWMTARRGSTGRSS